MEMEYLCLNCWFKKSTIIHSYLMNILYQYLENFKQYQHVEIYFSSSYQIIKVNNLFKT